MGLAKLLGTPTFNDTWWYLSFATLLIFLLPALVLLAKRIGGVNMLLISFTFPPFASMNMESIFWYYGPTLTLGVACAQYRVFERIGEALCNRKHKIAGAVLSGAFLIGALYLRGLFDFEWLFDALIALLVCCLSQQIDGVDRIFAFLGKHSMNMFFMHTFFYWYFFGPELYSLRWFLAVYLALVLVSLVTSVVIEFLKSHFRLNALRDRIVLALG